jgi:hypothetical protein
MGMGVEREHGRRKEMQTGRSRKEGIWRRGSEKRNTMQIT